MLLAKSAFSWKALAWNATRPGCLARPKLSSMSSSRDNFESALRYRKQAMTSTTAYKYKARLYIDWPCATALTKAMCL